MAKKLSFLLLFFSGCIYAQTNCENGLLYKSSEFKDGQTLVAMPLTYEFSGDTIFIQSDLPIGKRGDFARLLIVNKKCEWQDKKNGRSTYVAKIFNDAKTLKEIPSRLEVEMENGTGTIKLKHYQMPELFFTATVAEEE